MSCFFLCPVVNVLGPAWAQERLKQNAQVVFHRESVVKRGDYPLSPAS